MSRQATAGVAVAVNMPSMAQMSAQHESTLYNAGARGSNLVGMFFLSSSPFFHVPVSSRPTYQAPIDVSVRQPNKV